MPQLYFKVSETANRIVDPVVDQIKESLLKQYGLEEYFDSSEYIDNDRTAPTDETDGEGNVRFGNNRLDIQVETHYNPASQMWDTTVDHNNGTYGQSRLWANQYESIFNDSEIGTSVQELTTPFGLTLNVTMQFITYDAAMNALDTLLANNHGEVVSHVQDLSYTYPVPLTLMSALYAVFKNRSEYQSIGFQRYLQLFSSQRFGFDVRKYDLDKPDPETEFIVRKVQMNCLAVLTCDQDKPEVEKMDMAPAAYNVAFTYRIQFGRPQTLQLTMPVCVENKPLPPILFQKPDMSFYKKLVGSMQTATFNSVVRRLDSGPDMDATLIRLPDYDDWTPNGGLTKAYHYSALFIGVLQITPGTPSTIDLNDLGGITFSPQIKTILGLHTADDLFGVEGLYNVTIYSNDIQVDRSLLDFDPETLTVSVIGNKIKNIYRIVISEALDVKTVNPKWYPVLIQYRYYYPMTIQRSLAYLTSLGYYAITPDHTLLKLINKVKMRGLLDPIIQSMIASKRVDSKIYQYTQTTEQFADYLTNTRAKVFSTDADTIKESSTLFDVFCAVCIKSNLITETTLPDKYLRTPKGYPYGAGQGGFYEFNVPIRVWNVVIDRREN